MAFELKEVLVTVDTVLRCGLASMDWVLELLLVEQMVEVVVSIGILAKVTPVELVHYAPQPILVEELIGGFPRPHSQSPC